MYKVTNDLKLKIKGVVKVFLAGSLINLPEEAAQMFIQQGKLVPVFEPVDDLNERMAIAGENTEPEEVKPYVTKFGVLVIPWNSDPRYYYWKSGMIKKYKSLYSDN